MYGNGTQIRDFTYVVDVVNANLLAALAGLAPGAIVNIAGGASTTLSERHPRRRSTLEEVRPPCAPPLVIGNLTQSRTLHPARRTWRSADG